MAITLTATKPDKTVAISLRHGETTPGPNSIYPAPGVSMRKGDSKVLEFTVYDGQATPVAVNISTYTTVTWGIFKGSSVTPTLSKTGALVSSGTTGKFTVTLDPGDTSALEANNYTMEVQVSGTGFKKTIARGQLQLLPVYG